MKLLADKRGMALLLALMVVAILVTVTVQLATTVNWQLYGAYNQADTLRLDSVLVSGLHIGLALVASDAQNRGPDTLFDEWALYEPNKLSAFFGDEEVDLKIVDLSGRLQINALVRENRGETGSQQSTIDDNQKALWSRLLNSGRFAVEGEEETEALLEALADWIDEDDEERLNGAENGYYQSLGTGISCRNAPFLHPEELLAVKGMSRELLYGTDEKDGLINYITVYGRDGKININTADPLILGILADGIPEDVIEALVEYRSDESNKESLGDTIWYKNVSGFPSDIDITATLLRTDSFYFQVTVNASHEKLTRQGVGIIKHSSTGQELLSWKLQ